MLRTAEAVVCKAEAVVWITALEPASSSELVKPWGTKSSKNECSGEGERGLERRTMVVSLSSESLSGGSRQRAGLT